MRILTLTVTVFAAVVLTGCSEILPRNDVFEPIAKNSLIVLDQQNQSVSAFDTVKNKNILLGTLPTTTPNDVKIKGDFAYVVLSSPFSNPSDGNKLVRYNLTTGDRTFLSLALGSNPYNQAIDGSNIYITLSVSNQVAVVDIDSFSVSQLIDLSPVGAPYGIAYDSDNIYVATSVGYIGWGDAGNYTNSRITVIAKSNFSQVTNIPCGKNPMSLALNGGKLYIAEASDYDNTGNVEVMDIATFSFSNLTDIPACSPYIVKSAGNRLFVLDGNYFGNNGLYICDLSNSTVTNILNGVTLQGIDNDSNFVYLSEAYSGTKSYRVNLSNFSVETINGIGGGDCALYQ